MCLHAQQYGKQTPYGNKGEVFTESCFKNPSAPYCIQRDFVVKPQQNGKGHVYGTVNGKPVESTVDSAGIDWRFADPAADSLAVLNGEKFAAASAARSLVEGTGRADAQKVIQTLSGAGQIALSTHDGKVVMMVTGRAADAILPAMDSGWKALPIAGSNALLIGNTDAVDQAAERISAGADLTELPAMGLLRAPESELWVGAPAMLAGPLAAEAGVKWVEMSSAVTDKVRGDVIYKFDAAPDAAKIGEWMKSLGGATVEGNVVRVKGAIDGRNMSAAGFALTSLFASAGHLPARETAETVHAHPVIYGLDGGPRETK